VEGRPRHDANRYRRHAGRQRARVSVDCLGGTPIPQYRLVYFQVDREARNRPDLPLALRKSSVLSAVFRVDPAASRPAPERLCASPVGRTRAQSHLRASADAARASESIADGVRSAQGSRLKAQGSGKPEPFSFLSSSRHLNLLSQACQLFWKLAIGCWREPEP
jgi:hypothetical protein